MLMDEDDNRQHFSMKGIMAGEAATTSKAKRKKLQKMKRKQGASQVEDTFKVRYSQVISYNLSKSRFFLSIFSSADFCQAEELISDFFLWIFIKIHWNCNFYIFQWILLKLGTLISWVSPQTLFFSEFWNLDFLFYF